VFLIGVLLKEITDLLSLHPVAAFRLYVCSYNPQSMMSPVKKRVYMYLRYILVITYMFSAIIQKSFTSYLTTQNVHLPDLISVVLDCLPLQQSRYITSKS